jgi:regulator-associated protein of mTOR
VCLGVQGVPNVTEHRAMCAFIIAMFCKDFPQGQNVCLSPELVESCLIHLADKDNPLLRQWSCLCLSMLWYNFPEAKWLGIKSQAHQKLCDLVVDCVAEVRAAMLHALTSFLGIPDLTPQIAHIEESIASMVLIMASDGNTMVRKELLVFFSHFIARYQNRFLVAAYEQLVTESNRSQDRALKGMANDLEDPEFVASHSVYSAIWRELLILAADPYPELAENACKILDSIYDLLLASPLATYAAPLIEQAMRRRRPMNRIQPADIDVSLPTSAEHSGPPSPPTPSRNEGYLTASLKRTASVAASLKNFAFGIATPTDSPRGQHGSMTSLPIRTGSRLDLSQVLDKGAHTSQGNPINTPLPRGFEPTYLASTPGRQPRPHVHVIESTFFDWAVEYFREPQMQAPEAEEPGSTDYNERLWRRNRNDRIIAKTQPLKEMAGTSPWDKPKGFWNNGSQPVKICWHQFEEHIIVTDEKDGIS